MAEVIRASKRLVREVRKAMREGGLTDSGQCVAEGPRLFEDARRSGRPIRAAVVSGAFVERYEGRLDGIRTAVLGAREFEALAGTETTQGILTLVDPPAVDVERLFGAGTLLLVLDGVQDPGNAGAMLRAAEAFGAAGAVFLKGTVSPHNAKAVRATAGSIFRLPVAAGWEGEQFVERARGAGIEIYAAMPRAGLTGERCDFRRGCAIVIGGEGGGVSESVRAAAKAVTIPVRGVESLNASVAAAILLYEAARQRGGGVA
jgi:TrmH family RNA methyltransferase